MRELRLTDDGEGYEYVYDPFGRLIEVNTSTTEVSQYRYDGLNRRIAYRHDEDADDDVDDETWVHLVYDERWRVVATFRGSDSDPKEFYAHHAPGLGGTGGSSYIDSVILRDADFPLTSASDGTLERRSYYCQNWRADVSVILGSTGGVLEWVKYDPYGTPYNLSCVDTNSDGDSDAADGTYMVGLHNGTYSYDVRGDLDLDGTVEYNDDYLNLFRAAVCALEVGWRWAGCTVAGSGWELAGVCGVCA